MLTPAIAEARGIEPQLVAEGPAPPGGEVELAIEMRTDPGWHGYWLNPGDAGLPMDVKWTAAARAIRSGACATRCRARLTVAGIMNYVYEKDYAVLVRLKVPKDASGAVPIRAAANWLACTDKICVPEQGEIRARCYRRRRARQPLANSSTSGAARCRGRSPTQAKFAIAGDKLARRDPAAAQCRGREALSVPGGGRASRLCRASSISAGSTIC